MSTLLLGQNTQTHPSQNTRPLNKELKFNLDAEGKTYVKFTASNQVWIRYNENNPGTTVGTTSGAITSSMPEKNTFDIGIRRIRFQLYGQLTERMFFYTQFGQNNLSYTTQRFAGSFFHDGTIEYKVSLAEKLSIGAGLNGWTAPLRYSQASIISCLALDLPTYQEFTNGVNDQFLRKLGVYAKGKLGKLDYRIMIAKPLLVQNSNAPIAALNKESYQFSLAPNKPMLNSYFMFQFKDQESNLTPYMTGCYLGQKTILNFGAGLLYQNNAMWRINDTTGSKGSIKLDTSYAKMMVIGTDIFFDTPVNADKGTAFTIYAAYSHQDFGKNYFRYGGLMNTGAGMSPSYKTAVANSANGNAYPYIGTGNNFHIEAGYLMKRGLLPHGGTIQPFFTYTVGKLQAIKDPIAMYEVGLNWLIHGLHSSKISLQYQNRGTYEKNNSEITETGRKGMFLIQIQLGI